jgi:hypothetical protein
MEWHMKPPCLLPSSPTTLDKWRILQSNWRNALVADASYLETMLLGRRMISTLHVLSVGSLESDEFVRDALLLRHKCPLFATVSYQDICAVPLSSRIEIAILNQTLSGSRLLDSTEYIRRHWLGAKNLRISASSEIADGQLYDEWMRSGLSQ